MTDITTWFDANGKDTIGKISDSGDIYLSLVLGQEKAVAPHSNILAWELPWTEEPGRLQSMGLQRVGHDWATSLSLFSFLYWRRQWHPTPVLLPGKSHGWRSLVGCSPWGRSEWDMTERLHFHFSLTCIGEEWQPTPVLLPGEPQGRRSLVGCSLWGRTESDTTEAT